MIDPPASSTASSATSDRHHGRRGGHVPQFAGPAGCWAGCWPTSCAAMGLADVEQDAHGLVLGTVPATVKHGGAGRGVQCPRRYLAGNDRQGRQAAGDSQLRRRRHSARRATPTQGDSRRRQSRAASARRQDAHHHRRHDAAGRRRQGRRRRHHGSWPHAGRASARSRTARSASASPATRRSATASITSI